MRASSYFEYQFSKTQRARIVSENKSRRWRKDKPALLELPEALDAPLVRVAYSSEGYEGVLYIDSDIDPAWTIKLEPAKREHPSSAYVNEHGQFVNK
jgi:hypothetical protein